MTGREHWDKIEWERGKAPFARIAANAIVQTLLANDTGLSALDLACGHGILTQEICRRFDRVVGVDASRHHIKVAQKRVPEAEFHVSMIEDFNPRGEAFNMIYMFGIIEHLDNPVETLRLVRGWLSSEGKLLVHTPNALSLNRRIGKEMGIIRDCYELTPSDIAVGHKRLYDLDKLVTEVRASGMHILDKGGDMLKPFSNNQMQWFIENWQQQENDKEWCDKLYSALHVVGNQLTEYANAVWVRCR